MSFVSVALDSRSSTRAVSGVVVRAARVVVVVRGVVVVVVVVGISIVRCLPNRGWNTQKNSPARRAVLCEEGSAKIEQISCLVCVCVFLFNA